MRPADYLEEINKIIADAYKGELPLETVVLATVMKEVRPQIPPTQSSSNRSSREIAEMLEDICTLDFNTITAVMLRLGFELYMDEPSGLMGPQWSIMRLAGRWEDDFIPDEEEEEDHDEDEEDTDQQE